MRQRPAVTASGSYQILRVVYLIMLGVMFVYVGLAEAVQHEPLKMNSKFLTGLAVIAVAMIGGAIYGQTKVIAPTIDALRERPGDAGLLGRWRGWSIAAYVMAEGVVLFGLCLRFLGGSRAQAIPFYVAGIGVMLFLVPRRP